MKYNYLKIDNDAYPNRFSINFLNYPNPFNGQTNFSYDLPETSDVSIVIYDIKGNIVKHLVNEYQTKGPKIVTWNATAKNGEQVSTGVYLYRLIIGNKVLTNKTIYLK